jgi:hypothetical protein
LVAPEDSGVSPRAAANAENSAVEGLIVSGAASRRWIVTATVVLILMTGIEGTITAGLSLPKGLGPTRRK